MDNVTSPSSRGKSVLIVTATTFVVATIFVVARLVSRFGILKKTNLDDWVIIVAWVLAFGLSFTIDFGTSRGLGKHDTSITASEKPALDASEYAFTLLYNPALMTTKAAILIFYLRVTKDTQAILRIASYVILAIVCVAGIVLTFLNAFQCRPARSAYTPGLNGNCISVVMLYLCSAPVNVITDLAILVLPLPVLTRLHLPRKQKVILLATFALGTFDTIVDVIRIYYLQNAIDTQRSLTKQEQIGDSADFAWTASMALMWSAIEVNIAIICACIPTLRPLFQRILPSIIIDHLQSKSMPSNNFNPGPQSNPSNPSSRAPPELERVNQLQSSQEEIGAIDFITTPEMNQSEGGDERPRLNHIPTQNESNSVYFGFVDINRPKSIFTTTGKESFKYCAIVTVLFFLWGFSRGLLATLVEQIKGLAHETVKQDIGLTASYYVAYFFGPLTVGQCVLRHGGFKATFITGLCIYGTGAMMFWPSAVLTSYPGFIICQFVIGFGLSILETAANPFLALCGPLRYSEVRLLLAQGVQSIATVLSQLLSQKVLYANLSPHSLIDTQWTYLAIALFTVVLVLVFYYMKLPEAPDAELRVLPAKLTVSTDETFFSTRYPLTRITLVLAVFAQFCYIGCQESVVIWQALVRQGTERAHLTISINDYGLVTQTLFTISRFLCAGLCLVIRPRILLLLSFMLGIVFAVLIMNVSHPNSSGAAVTGVLFFFEGPMFPLIFAICLRGRGMNMAYVAAALLATGCSGAIFPFVLYIMVYDNHQFSHYAFCVVVALLAFGSLFPIYLTVVPKAGQQIDPIPKRLTKSELDHTISTLTTNNGIWQRLRKCGAIMIPRALQKQKSRRESALPIVGHSHETGQGLE